MKHSVSAGTDQAAPGGFEERLLAELKVMVAERARYGPGPQAGNALLANPGPRPRPVIAIAASVALAAGATGAAIAAEAGGQRPARTAHYTLAAVLDRAAAAARSAHTVSPRPGQVLYQVVQGGIRAPGSRFDFHCAVIWYGSPATGAQPFPSGNARCPGRGVPRHQGPFLRYAKIHGYPDPSALPTDPAALRARLEAAAARGSFYWRSQLIDYGNAAVGVPSMNDRAGIMFTLIERLLQVPTASTLRAALYEVIASIPGVHLVSHVTDMAGRPGVGIVLGPRSLGAVGPAVSNEFILDPQSYRFLGLEYVTRARSPAPGGRDLLTEHGFALIRSGLVTRGS